MLNYLQRLFNYLLWKVNMQETCGIFIINKNKTVLICRPTGLSDSGKWTIPKGKPEDNETYEQAALRETYEEVSLNFKHLKKQLEYIGCKTYKTKKKRLHAFILKLDYNLDIKDVKCDCKINGKDKMELDKFEFVSIKDAIQRLHESQSSLLKEYYDL